MKSIATTALAGLMLLGTISAIASSKSVVPGDGGPVPLCQPTDPNCPSPTGLTKTTKSLTPGDGGPVPLCQPTDPNCPSPTGLR